MFSLNVFADLSEQEFKVKYTGAAMADFNEYDLDNSSPVDVPDSAHQPQVDKISGLGQGYDIRIRNQGTCGSCWTFAAVAAFEKHYFDKTRQRLDFAQQELVDCDRSSSGCSGGFENRAVDYIKNNGITLAASYPYSGAQGVCRSGSTSRTKIAIALSSLSYSTSLS